MPIKDRTVIREDQDLISTLKEVKNWLAQGADDGAMNEIEMYGAAKFSCGFEKGEQFARRPHKRVNTRRCYSNRNKL